MNLKATAHNIDRLAQQEIPSYEKPTRNMAGKTTHQITRRTTLNDNRDRYEVIAYSRDAQFVITDGQKYTSVNIPLGADDATITSLIAAVRDTYNINYNN